MPKPEMPRRQAQRRSRENIAGPRAGIAWHDEWINPVAAVHRLLCADQTGIGRRGGWIVAARHIHIDVTEAAFCEMRFERLKSFVSCHVRNQPEVELTYCFLRHDNLSTATGISAYKPFYIASGLRLRQAE